MTSTFHGLEVGKRSLYTQQAALTTAGHNIANANTPGYSRQRVNMQATSPITYPYQTGSTSSQLGTGVSVQSIERIRSEYLDGQYRERNSMLGSESMKLETMQQIESLSGEPGENGISASLDRFWSAWEDLASNPDSTAARSVVVGRAEELLDQAKSFNKGLTSLKDSLEKQEVAVQNQIGSISAQIESLNKQISKNGNANDLMDRRDLLKDQLSGLVSTADGEVVGGKLKGIQDSIQLTENMKNDLNEMFKTLISGKEATTTEGKVTGLNDLMESGYSLIRNADGTMQEGKPLFTSDGNEPFLEGTTINQAVKANPSTIGASSKNDAISNGDIASAISDLRNKTFTFKLAGSDDSITTNVNDYYSTLVTRLASSAQSSERTVSNHESVLQSIDNNRMSVSGVSLDEEMANLVQFQHAYNAAARYISTTDEILDVIINRMGV
ncbi:flagellar hook-associated protein FlgK [Bacillus sp. NTK071]|uniref:flagellar hook-associated protein FlgK n=1 Tax=Bacillus sp. NTK071 TaxID=2802175 RepID=UPI001A8EAF11|nr:flagellar hook-associated protein FlgK [Bacillus sp. NTK071]MBN8208714.1 flagellar hook-associated protein FlgK [Bacillus sp. NTK071]